jgi:nucleoside 2-deoxyribosyltransferase
VSKKVYEAPRIYLAAPLFSQVERIWNRNLAKAILEQEPGWEITLPQDFRVKGKFNDPERFPELFRRCVHSLEASRAVIAILDGADVDSGVAFEVGHASARSIPVIGVRTDYREGQEKGVNLMLANGCTSIVRKYSFGEDLTALAREIARRVRKRLPSS